MRGSSWSYMPGGHIFLTFGFHLKVDLFSLEDTRGPEMAVVLDRFSFLCVTRVVIESHHQGTLMIFSSL